MTRGEVERLATAVADAADDVEGFVAGATAPQATLLNGVLRGLRTQRDALKKLAFQVGRGDIEQRILQAQQELAALDGEIGKL